MFSLTRNEHLLRIESVGPHAICYSSFLYSSAHSCFVPLILFYEDIIALRQQTSFEDRSEIVLPLAEDEPQETVVLTFGNQINAILILYGF